MKEYWLYKNPYGDGSYLIEREKEYATPSFHFVNYSDYKKAQDRIKELETEIEQYKKLFISTELET